MQTNKHTLKYLIILISVFTVSFSSSKRVMIDDHCEVFGIIYFEKSKYNADAFVFFEEDETLANLLVFKEDNRLFADEEGIWYITDNPAIATYRLYVCEEKRFADFSVNYIDDRAFVGCQF